MLGDTIFITEQHRYAAAMILEKIRPMLEEKRLILTISGEVGSGKATIAHALGQKLKQEGIKAKLMHMGNYYKVAPDVRLAYRLKHGMETIGDQEYDWDQISKTISDFQQKKKSIIPCVDLMCDQVDYLHTNFKSIDVLVATGLYAAKIEQADFKVFIELTYKETLEVQKAKNREPVDDFRMKILAREHEVVQSLKHLADFYIDFNSSHEIFHL